jgi:hypothetical protein
VRSLGLITVTQAEIDHFEQSNKYSGRETNALNSTATAQMGLLEGKCLGFPSQKGTVISARFRLGSSLRIAWENASPG